MSGSGPSATDVITYIGVPLAVLGVLPILYNTAATLMALSQVKRMLRHSRLTAMTRSDVVNRVIEVELPRYAATPWDRFRDRTQYWTLSRHPSNIPGGTWTTFNWRTNAIGLKTQRLEYADQLRQPQVDIAFDELVCYLLDLGARPDPHGWRLLRSTGLWTPAGTALMLSPDGRDKALSIAPLDDSDGNLSLAATWSDPWTTRDYSHLPPYWVRLPAPLPPPPPPAEKKKSAPAAGGEEEEEEASGSTKAKAGEKVAAKVTKAPSAAQEDAEASSSSLHKESLDMAEKEGKNNAQRHITCQISVDGIVTALTHEDQLQSSLHLDSLYIEHIRVRPNNPAGMWFASAATAYGTTGQTVLWNYKIPDEILAFARKDTVPCGVLVLLEVVPESATPEWATKYNNDSIDNMERHIRFVREQQDAIQAEMRMPEEQRQQASWARARRETDQQMQEMRDKMRVNTQRRETRMMEALVSPRWDTKLVAEHYLAWLKGRRELHDPSMTLKGAVGTLLHRMVLDGQFAASLCRMLELWKAWADNGGMRKSDMQALQGDHVAFAQATLLVAMIKDSSGALDGSLSMDLQDCLRMWRVVRLG